MSNHFQPVDDLTMEVATLVDEYSAVSAYRMKKEPPMQVSTKKPASFKSIAKTNFPEAKTGSKQEIPKSYMDMNYMGVISGKCYSPSRKRTNRVQIDLEECERKCGIVPRLTESQKRDIAERIAAQEKMLNSETDDHVKPGCSPCLSRRETDDHEKPGCSPCLSRRSTPKNSADELLIRVRQNSEDSKDGATEKEILDEFDPSLSSDISEVSTESNTDDSSTLTKPQGINSKTNITENKSSNKNEHNSEGKKKKTMFKKFFKSIFRKKK